MLADRHAGRRLESHRQRMLSLLLHHRRSEVRGKSSGLLTLLGRSLLHAHRRHALTLRRSPGRLVGQVLLVLLELMVRLLVLQVVGVLPHGTHTGPHPSMLAHSVTHATCRGLTINWHAREIVSVRLTVRVATAQALWRSSRGEGE